MLSEGFDHKPKEDENRFSFYDISADETCYNEALLNLRHDIIAARQSAALDILPMAKINRWFDSDNEALVNINQDSYIYSKMYKPTITIDSHFFLHKTSNNHHNLHKINQLEKEISNYLMRYNKKISKAHLNHPLNIFYIDLKHLLNHVQSQGDLKLALKTLPLLSRYTAQVEKSLGNEMAFEKVFMTEVSEAIQNTLIPEIEEIIETKNLKDNLITLSKEIQNVIEASETLLHHLFSTDDIDAHPLLRLDEDISQESELKKNPLHALKSCAEKSQSLTSQEPNTEVDKTPFDTLSAKDIDDCQMINLVTHLTEQEKEKYLSAIRALYRLTTSHRTLNNIIQMLDMAGEVSTTILLKTELESYLNEITTQLDTNKALIEETVKISRKLYKDGLINKGNENFIDKALNSLTSLFATDKKEHFMDNQETLSAIKHNDVPAAENSRKVKDTISQLLNRIEALDKKYKSGDSQKEAEKLISDINKQLPKALLSKPKNIAQKRLTDLSSKASDINQCYRGLYQQQTPVIFCENKEALTYIFNEDNNDKNPPLLGDNYPINLCKKTTFLEQEAAHCQGDNSDFLYVPKANLQVDAFFNQLDAQLALGFVLFRAVASGYEWLHSSNEEKVYAKSDEAKAFLKSAYQKLSKMSCKEIKKQGLKTRCNDIYEDLKTIEKKIQQNKSIEKTTIENLDEEITYFEKCTIRLSSFRINKEQESLKDTFLSICELEEDDFEIITNHLIYGENEIEDEAFTNLLEESYYPKSTLFALLEHWQSILSLSQNPAPVFESDIIDIKDNQHAISIKLSQGEVLHPSPNTLTTPTPSIGLGQNPNNFWRNLQTNPEITYNPLPQLR